MRRTLIHFVALLAIVYFVAPVSGDTFHVYYLGGQSNMDGYGQNSELPDALAEPVEGVYIFHGNPVVDAAERVAAAGRGSWQPLQPGHGVGFRANASSNAYSDRFGVELTFGRRMRELHPDRKIAIIKYSLGGTALDPRAEAYSHWPPGSAAPPEIASNQYDNALTTIHNAMRVSDIDGDGTADTLVPSGIVWMQGESDGRNREASLAYGNNLRRLMALLRAALHDDRTPVAIGLITDSMMAGPNGDQPLWPFGDLVRVAQGDFCETDGRAVLVASTENYGYSDAAHYDSAGYIDFGREFAQALEKFEK